MPRRPTAPPSRKVKPPGDGEGPVARAPRDPVRWPRHVLAIAALWAVTLAAYGNSFRAAFLFDSTQIILQDARLRAATTGNVRLISTTEYWFPGLYRPLTTLTYLFNYAVVGGGAQPDGYHAVNFALHAVNILLVYLLGLTVFGEVSPALGLAALWALHPVLTESVTNIAGRADLLAALGVLAGLLCHIRAATRSGWRKAAWLVALLAAVTLGQFSKENAAVVVAVMLLYDLLFGTAAARARHSWSARLPGYAVAALPLLVYWYCRSRVLAQSPHTPIAFLDNPLTGTDFWTARITALKVLGKYLWLWLWPGKLACDYSYNQVPLFDWRLHNWEAWKTVAAAAAWGVIVALAVRSYRRNKPLCFFIAFFLVTLAPTSNLVILIGSIMAERFLYLPSIGFAGCAVVALHWACRKLTVAWPRARLAAPIALAAICAALVSRTYARNADWLDGGSLWTGAVRSAPASYKTHLNLALTALGNQPPDLDLAARELAASLAITGGLPDDRQNEYPYLMAGMCYRIKGDTLASRDAGGALVPGPLSGLWYERSLEALRHADQIDHIVPERNRGDHPLRGPRAPMSGTAAIYEQLGHTFMRLGRPAPAVAAYAHSRFLHPELNSFAEMAAAYTAMGDLRGAIITLLEGLVAFPNDTGFAPQAARLYGRMDPPSCAARGGGSSLNRECPAVQRDLCAAGRNVIQLYTQAGMPQEAAAVRLRVVNGMGCAVE
ncbi:MAG: hypothetical protein ABSB88_14555 [Bryobacteraceae bacterium]